MEKVTTAKDPNPLVSIIVIAYNSAKYVLETLESSKAQTYQNIELIIADDASQDDTVEICRNWLDENKERFVRTEMVTVGENTGTSANCNRGLYKAEGDWVKFIAGDDILIIDAIETLIEFISDKDFIPKVISSKVYILLQKKDAFIRTNEVSGYNEDKSFIEMSSTISANGFFIPAPGVFINKNFITFLGGFDENYRNIEDVPLWWKILHLDNKIYILNKATVYYRKHQESLTGERSPKFNYEEAKMHIAIFNKYRKSHLRKIEVWEGRVNQFKNYLLIFLKGKYQLKMHEIDSFNHILKPKWWKYRYNKLFRK